MADSIRVYERIREIPAQAWDALHTDDDSPFVSHEWLCALEDTGCASSAAGWQPSHLTRWRDGQLVAAAPAYLKRHSEGEFVFDFQWANVAARLGVDYYPKLLVAVPFTPATGSRLLRAPGEDLGETARALGGAARELVKKYDLSSAHVLFPHEREAGALEDEAGFARRCGVQFHWQNAGYKGDEDFLSRFQSKRRHAIKTERAQPAKDRVTITTHEGDGITPELVEPMFRFYRSTVDKFMWGRRYLNRAFFERVAQTFKHRLAWVVARDEGGRPIAGAFNARRGGVLYGRYWGATEERKHLHFNVCFYHGISECIARGDGRFEPGAGGEHKLARGFEPALTHSAHFIADRRLDGVLRDFLSREGPAVRNAVEREREGGPLRRKQGVEESANIGREKLRENDEGGEASETPRGE